MLEQYKASYAMFSNKENIPFNVKKKATDCLKTIEKLDHDVNEILEFMRESQTKINQLEALENKKGLLPRQRKELIALRESIEQLHKSLSNSHHIELADKLYRELKNIIKPYLNNDSVSKSARAI